MNNSIKVHEEMYKAWRIILFQVTHDTLSLSWYEYKLYRCLKGKRKIIITDPTSRRRADFTLEEARNVVDFYIPCRFKKDRRIRKEPWLWK